MAKYKVDLKQKIVIVDINGVVKNCKYSLANYGKTKRGELNNGKDLWVKLKDFNIAKTQFTIKDFANNMEGTFDETFVSTKTGNGGTSVNLQKMLNTLKGEDLTTLNALIEKVKTILIENNKTTKQEKINDKMIKLLESQGFTISK